MTDLLLAITAPPSKRRAAHNRGGIDIRPWTDDEIVAAEAWRAMKPPMTYNAIGAALGGRSEQAVRLKLYDRRMAAKRGGNRPNGWSAEARAACVQAPHVVFPDLMLCDAVMKSGGMSLQCVAWQTFHGKRMATLVRTAPNGVPRPKGWSDGMPTARMNGEQLQHVADIQAWWRIARLALKHTPTSNPDH